MFMMPGCTTTSDRLSLATLNPHLTGVKTYCKSRDQIEVVARRFRSHELEENARRAFSESCHTRFSPEILRQLDKLHTQRELIIINQGTEGTSTQDEGGRLLIVNWRASLFDGACSPITHGFLDDDCMPGWDTWVRVVSLDESQTSHGLVCWIPPEMVQPVNDAITIEPAQCMSWLQPDSEGKLNLTGWGNPS